MTTLDCDKPYQWLGVLGSDPDFTERDAWFASVGLLYWMDADGGSCYPSQATLARRLRCCVRTVRRMLRRFESRGWLRIVRGGAPGRIPTDLFVPCIPAVVAVDEASERGPETASPVEVPAAAGTPLSVVRDGETVAPARSAVFDEALEWSRSEDRGSDVDAALDELARLYSASLSADELDQCERQYLVRLSLAA